MRKVLLLLVLIGCAAACTAVDGDHILGSDLARADARYAALPAGLTVGFPPIPGRQRVLDVAFLSALARRYEIDAEGLLGRVFEEAVREAK